jgi:hypothetical protein
MIPALSGMVHPLAPVGVAVTLEPCATASWVECRALPDMSDVAVVGHGFVVTAVSAHRPVPSASATGPLPASASEPPPANWSAFSRSRDTNPPFPVTFHWVTVVAPPAVEVSAVSTVMTTRPTAATRMRPFIALPLTASAYAR